MVVAGVVAAIEEHQPPPEADGWLSSESAARYLDMTTAALRAATRRGVIRGHRNGSGKWVYRIPDLDRHQTAGDR